MSKKILVVVSEWGFWGEELVGPLEAFEEAAAILMNPYTALAGQTTIEAGPSPVANGGNGQTGAAGEEPATSIDRTVKYNGKSMEVNFR